MNYADLTPHSVVLQKVIEDKQTASTLIGYAATPKVWATKYT